MKKLILVLLCSLIMTNNSVYAKDSKKPEFARVNYKIVYLNNELRAKKYPVPEVPATIRNKIVRIVREYITNEYPVRGVCEKWYSPILISYFNKKLYIEPPIDPQCKKKPEAKAAAISIAKFGYKIAKDFCKHDVSFDIMIQKNEDNTYRLEVELGICKDFNFEGTEVAPELTSGK